MNLVKVLVDLTHLADNFVRIAVVVVVMGDHFDVQVGVVLQFGLILSC